MTKTRVKIKVADLMAKIQEEIDAKQAQYKKEKEKYDKNFPIAEENLKNWLESEFEKILASPKDKLKISSSYRSKEPDTASFYIPVKYRLPAEPIEPKVFVNKAWKDMKILSLSSDEIITITSDSDWAKYL